MTTLKDYLRDLVKEARSIKADELPMGEGANKITEEQAVEEAINDLVDEYTDIIKVRLIRE